MLSMFKGLQYHPRLHFHISLPQYNLCLRSKMVQVMEIGFGIGSWAYEIGLFITGI